MEVVFFPSSPVTTRWLRPSAVTGKPTRHMVGRWKPRRVRTFPCAQRKELKPFHKKAGNKNRELGLLASLSRWPGTFNPSLSAVAATKFNNNKKGSRLKKPLIFSRFHLPHQPRPSASHKAALTSVTSKSRYTTVPV